MEFIIDLSREPFDLMKIQQEPNYIKLISRYSGVFSQPFNNSADWSIFSYVIFSFGMFLEIPKERKDFFMNKILDTCRVIFFLAGTLLILLGVARMGVLLYQDITVGIPNYAIGVKSPNSEQK
jgi:hypothetical protein